MHFPFDNRYIGLGERFYVKTEPTAVAGPSLIRFNEELANHLGILIQNSTNNDIAHVFAGNAIPQGAQPVAMAYAGHQFGHFVPQLGDGRALLLGEINNNAGVRFGLHFKGSGRTYFSRNGDGRAALGPVLREYLVSEAMAKLQVPTTRALAAVATGEQVAREHLLPGGVITRVARSFVRVGTFEYFRARDDVDSIRHLADFMVQTLNTDISQFDNPYISLLQSVVDSQAALISQWMQFGFIHGVMNTDNMSIAGETIDYGPCAFMDTYQHDKVFSSIDQNGRYAYNNQPSIGLWNLTRLAECLIPLLSDDTNHAIEIAQAVLSTYIDAYHSHWLSGMRAKCGLTAVDGTDQQDKTLITTLLDVMDANHADFTLTFYQLSGLTTQASDRDAEIRTMFTTPAAFDRWAQQWRERLHLEKQIDEERMAAMQKVNPVYIPRNHQIEAAIRAAEDHNDFSKFHELYNVLLNPFTTQPGKESYQLPPKPEEEVEQTFCGT